MATITGTAGNDTLTGTANQDTIYGQGGSDLIYGNAADDFIFGAKRNDMTEMAASTIDAGDGDDFVVLDNGDDVLIGGNGLDTLNFRSGGPGDLTLDLSITTAQNTGYGNKTISGFENVDIWEDINVNIAGNAENNVISTRDGIDTIYGRWGDDRISVRNGDDFVHGGAGNDAITVQGANNTVYGGAGDDYVLLEAGTGNNLIDLGAGDDDLLHLTRQVGTFDIRNPVTAQNDTIRGVEAIRFDNYGTTESLTFHGSDRIDRYQFRFMTGLDATLGRGDDYVSIGDSTGQLATGLGDDTISGSGLLDVVLSAGAGADSILVHWVDGPATINGGDGDDFIKTYWSQEAIVLSGGAGNDTVEAIWSYVPGADGFAGTLTGGAGNDYVSGGNSANSDPDDAGYRLDGGTGNDTLRGTMHADFLIGGTGADSMSGDRGDDIYVVDHAGDIVTESNNAGHDLVRSTVSFTLGTYVEDLTLRGARAIDGTGNALANTLRGNNAANELRGEDGNDLLIGQAGNDTLAGGVGVDTLIGGAGNDTYIADSFDSVRESANAGWDQLHSWSSTWLGNNIEALVLRGNADASGFGNALDNRIEGNAGNNFLSGGDGNDTLIGGLGWDRFVFHSGHDVVSDFETGTDILRIDDAVWGGTPRSAADLVAAAQITGSGVLFDFGADDSILLEGLTSKTGLEDDLVIV